MTNFATLEASLNTAVIGAIGNAAFAWGTATVTGVFEARYQDSLGLANAAPRLRVLSTAVPGIAPGANLTLTYPPGVATAYVVRALEADGTGLVDLILERA